jgi:hypothetical protein
MLTVISPAVFVQETGTSKGRGVYASRSYQPGELVETSPVLLIDSRHFDLPHELTKYVFSWQGLTGGEPRQALAFGYGCLYNHANPANMRYSGDAEKSCIHFIAERAIGIGEELTINYNGLAGASCSEGEIWFDAHEVPVYSDGAASGA